MTMQSSVGLKRASLSLVALAVLGPLSHARVLPDVQPTTRSTLRIALGVNGPQIVHGTLRLRGNVVYELHDDLRVLEGTLFIEAGARVEATAGVSIVVDRLGRIDAQGTLSEPIVLTCGAPVAPGCWDGLVINGTARVNSGTPTSPILHGRDATGGCLEISATAGNFGGCQDNDSSGVMRHVWVENGGGPGGAGLALRAIGAHTLIENVHVFRGGGRGVELRGGTVNLRYVRIVTPDSVGLFWHEGWRGHAQHGIIQAKSGARSAISGGNLAVTPDALPRSAPVLRNFTIIGPNTVDVGSSAAGVRLHSGTAATLQSFVVSNQPATGAWLLDIDDNATWVRFANGEVKFESSYFIGFAPLGSLDVDPPQPGFFSPDVEGQYLRSLTAANRIIVDFDSISSQLKAPYGTLQDLRPQIPGPLFDASCTVPAGDPFFDGATHCGALQTGTLVLIPWNEPGPVAQLSAAPPPTPFGYLYVLVASNQVGPIAGAQIAASNFLGVSDITGYARMYVSAGLVAYSLTNLPPGCANPGIFFVNVPPNGSAGQTAVVQCNS